MATNKFEKLHIEDALEDTPQMRALVDVFEKDTNMLKKYFKAFLSSCQKIVNAQTMMISASQELSYYLRLYEKQNFPLDTSSNDEKNTLVKNLNQFAKYIDETTSWYQVLITQLNDTMIDPLNKFIENEFDDLATQSEQFKISSDEQDQMWMKFLKLPNKRENELQRQQSNEEVYMYRKKFHQTAMNYYSSLNALQYKRNFMLLDPIVSLIHGMKLFFKMGYEGFHSTNDINDFLNDIGKEIQETKDNLNEEVNKTTQLIDLIQQDDSVYYAESSHTQINENVDLTNVFYKSGYLNIRTKYPFISKWDRYYCFTQNGVLMHQQKNEIAGYPLIDLKSDLILLPIEIDERRFAFQINSLSAKKTVIFQANSEKDRDEWLKILTNIVKDDSKTKLINYMSSASAVPAPSTPTHKDIVANIQSIRFDLPETPKKTTMSDLQQKEKTSAYYETFDVRYLGLMNVKADKGNEYIHETIRQIMAERAKKNLFKMNKLKLIITDESIYLINDENTDENEATASSSQAQPQIVCEFRLADIAFWCVHKENDRLFGFIMKEKCTNQQNQIKFYCYSFECDINTQKICDSITQSTQIAFKKLLELNKIDNLKQRTSEKQLLLENINKLPDKAATVDDVLLDDDDDDDEELIDVGNEANALKLSTNNATANQTQLLSTINSPNPNFFILDKDDLDDFHLDDATTTNSTSVVTNDEATSTTSQQEHIIKRVESDA